MSCQDLNSSMMRLTTKSGRRASLDGFACVGVLCADILARQSCQRGVRSMSRNRLGNISPMAERLCLQHSSLEVLLRGNDAIFGVSLTR
jgi:hypothetical protein